MGFELRRLQTGNRRRAAEFLRSETLRYLLNSLTSLILLNEREGGEQSV